MMYMTSSNGVFGLLQHFQEHWLGWLVKIRSQISERISHALMFGLFYGRADLVRSHHGKTDLSEEREDYTIFGSVDLIPRPMETIFRGSRARALQ
jgi:hypothetical protein